jgi:hypothetical protein
MKILRSVNRRGSTIESAGYFTVLKSNTWFPASRLRESFGDLVGQSEGIAPAPESISVPELKAARCADKQETTLPLQTMMPCTDDQRPVRLVLIVLAAAAITLITLFWLVGFIPRIAGP